jgi:hypothetical protein
MFLNNISPPSSGSKVKSSNKAAGLLFDSDDRSDWFLRNVRLSASYAVFKLRRPHNSQSLS